MSSAEQQLVELMQALMGRRIDVAAFAAQFETVLNFQADKSLLHAEDHAALSRVFEVVVWFSPFPDDRARIASYRSPDDVYRAVQQCLRELGSLADRRS